MPKDQQEIKDLVGKYSEAGGRGSRVISVKFTQDEDASYNLSVTRQDYPLSAVRSSHVFHGRWNNGEFCALTLSDSYLNETKNEVKVLKSLRIGKEPGNNFLTMVIAEYRILDYEQMEANGNLTLAEWKDIAPTADVNLLVYSKLLFPRDGSLHFFLKRADHSVEEVTVYAKEDNLRRGLFDDGIDLEEAKNLKKIYEGCLQRAEDLEVFNDGQSQGLVQALIESELRADIQVNDAEDSNTDSSSLPTDDDGAEEEAGKLLV